MTFHFIIIFYDKNTKKINFDKIQFNSKAKQLILCAPFNFFVYLMNFFHQFSHFSYLKLITENKQITKLSLYPTLNLFVFVTLSIRVQITGLVKLTLSVSSSYLSSFFWSILSLSSFNLSILSYILQIYI